LGGADGTFIPHAGYHVPERLSNEKQSVTGAELEGALTSLFTLSATKLRGTGYLATKKIGQVATHRIPQMADPSGGLFVYSEYARP